MDSIRIDSGVKRIAINDDESRVIEFNPSDVLFAERFYSVYGEFEKKHEEYKTKAKKLGAENVENIGEGIVLAREMCAFMREKIDILFGAGTSQKVFGDTLSMAMISQFLEGMTPFFEHARSEKTKKYINTASKRRVMK